MVDALNTAAGSAGEYAWLLMVVVVLAGVVRWAVYHRTEERREREREREYTRRVEAALAGTESRHRAEVVVACLHLRR
ncbi:hypothetical protein ACIP5L_10305 [Streptomyces bacillaris]|uniref:hypothetical protein n=1 Tax=Streptomyces bacillaris TaxID=68179 RepID=UPI00382925C6